MKFEIPGRDTLSISHLVLDYNGTIAFDGQLISGVAERLAQLARHLEVHIISADTFGSCRTQCQKLDCHLHLLENTLPGGPMKEKLVQHLGPAHVAAIGNGTNDMAMLEKAALGIAVLGPEGLCANTLSNADLVVADICAALDLLLHPERLVATLRR